MLHDYIYIANTISVCRMYFQYLGALSLFWNTRYEKRSYKRYPLCTTISLSWSYHPWCIRICIYQKIYSLKSRKSKGGFILVTHEWIGKNNINYLFSPHALPLPHRTRKPPSLSHPSHQSSAECDVPKIQVRVYHCAGRRNNWHWVEYATAWWRRTKKMCVCERKLSQKSDR